MDGLFPQEILDNSQEKNFSRHTITTKGIYFSLLLIVISAIVALPFIELEVGVRGGGMVRPAVAILPVTAAVSGYVEMTNMSENKSVEEGDLLVLIRSPELKEKIRLNEKQQLEERKHHKDVKRLLEANEPLDRKGTFLKTPRYRSVFNEFHKRLAVERQRLTLRKKEYERKKHLHDRKMISHSLFEEAGHRLEEAEGAYELLLLEHKTRWEQEKMELERRIETLEKQHLGWLKKAEKHKIRAPVKGTLLNVAGITGQSYIFLHQKLAEISPDTGLVAELYLASQHIGLLKEGMRAIFQIDAYPHHQWGGTSGQILYISSDMHLIEGEPFFRIQCSIDDSYLQLANGVKGNIQKGMAIQARFIVARRTLLQLLFDKADDWLNPSWN